MRSEKGKPHLGRTKCQDGRITDAACFEVFLGLHRPRDRQGRPVLHVVRRQRREHQDVAARCVVWPVHAGQLRRRILTDDLPHFCAGCPTYIGPRSEAVRHRLVDFIPRGELAQWDKWAGLDPHREGPAPRQPPRRREPPPARPAPHPAPRDGVARHTVALRRLSTRYKPRAFKRPSLRGVSPRTTKQSLRCSRA